MKQQADQTEKGCVPLILPQRINNNVVFTEINLH